MVANPQIRLRTNTVCRPTKHADASPVKYLVIRDLLSIEIDPLGRPKLVVIPAQSVVELKGGLSVGGMVELVWEQRIHRVFKADMSRLNIHRNGVNLAYYAEAL